MRLWPLAVGWGVAGGLGVGEGSCVGLLLAWALEAFVRWFLRAVGFDRVRRRHAVAEARERTSLHQAPSALVGQLVRWLVVVVTPFSVTRFSIRLPKGS